LKMSRKRNLNCTYGLSLSCAVNQQMQNDLYWQESHLHQHTLAWSGSTRFRIPACRRTHAFFCG
jgi:hypothetical protein